MPNRIIKESILDSESLSKLSWFEQVLFFKLIVMCDDFGRADARPQIIRGRAFALHSVTDKQIQESLSHLEMVGIVDLYTVGGKPYLQLKTWEKHQNVRAKKSKYPSLHANESNCMQMYANENNCMQMHADESKCSRNPIQSNPNPIQSNLIERGTDKPSSTRFIPPALEEIEAYRQERGSDVDPQKFYDYFQASGWIDSNGKKVKNWKQKYISWEGRQHGASQNRPASNTGERKDTGRAFDLPDDLSGRT